jgi:outer membrane protein assembly factor BamB/plastocyanin
MTQAPARIETRHRRRGMLAVPLSLTLLVSGAGGTSANELIDPSDEWPLPNQDYHNTRNAPAAAIDSSNVEELGVAWTMAIPAAGPDGAAAGGLVINAGVVYFQDLRANLFAVVLESGDIIWEQRYDSALVGSTGPAIDGKRVYASVDDHTFAALDIVSGEELWTHRPEAGLLGAIQPTAYDGTVYYATQAGDGRAPGDAAGKSGVVHAADAATGDVLWSFQVVPDDSRSDVDTSAGGGVGHAAAIDTETGLTFWGTGSLAPFPGTADEANGASLPGPNLYTSSVIALGRDDGALEWHYQAVEHDIFGHDLQVAPILARVEIDAEPRDIVIASGTVGDVVALDRTSGELVWRTQVGAHQNDDLEELPMDEDVEVYPGIFGGVASPMAFAEGMVYVPVVNVPTIHSATGHDAADATEAFDDAVANTQLEDGTGALIAIDAASGEIAWQQELESPVFAGATISGDLVFTATYDGLMRAFERTNGEPVWAWQAPAGINAWPAVADDFIVWPAGLGGEPQLLALRLGGAAGSAPDEGAATPITLPAETAAPPTTAPVETPEAPARPGPGATQDADASWPPPGSAHPDVAPDTIPREVEPGRADVPEGEPAPIQLPEPDASGEPAVARSPAPASQGDGDPTPRAVATMVPSPSPTAPEPTSGQTAAATEADVVELELVAEDTSFDKDELVVPAGSTVRLTMHNRDAIPHTFTVYESDFVAEPIFLGESLIGPDASHTYEFRAPDEPGEYFFRCEFHPTHMNGTFIVE